MLTNRYFMALLWFCGLSVLVGVIILMVGRGMQFYQPGGNLALILVGAALMLVGLIAVVISLGVAAVLHSIGGPARLAQRSDSSAAQSSAPLGS